MHITLLKRRSASYVDFLQVLGLDVLQRFDEVLLDVVLQTVLDVSQLLVRLTRLHQRRACAVKHTHVTRHIT